MGACEANGRGWIGGGSQIGEELGGGEFGGRNAKVRSDFGKGDEDEGALGKAGMRDFEAGLVQDEIAIEEDVEVESARAVGPGGGAVAAKEALDGKKCVEKGTRGEIGFKGNDGVEKARLIGETDRGSGIERRTRPDVSNGRELRERCSEGGIGRAGGAGKVGSEGNVGDRHGTRVAELAGLAVLANPWRLAHVDKLAD